MSLITQATRVTKAVKNIPRLREIARVMTRFGFGEIAARMGLAGGLPWERRRRADEGPERALPERIRLLLEQLGPAFIKAGQVLAGRPDLVPPELVRELEKLQDDVRPVPFTLLQPAIEEDLERPLHACFASFDTEPLATASIAQVHAARTVDGDDVVVKVKKPGVDKILARDLEILEFLAGVAEKYLPEIRQFRPGLIVAEFKKALLQEIDFSMELNNTKRFRENFRASSFLVVPRVYADLCGKRVLTLERLRGVKLSDIEGVRAMGIDSREVLRQGMDCFFQSMMIDGFFHGDPHAGNIMVLPDGRMGLLDFGSVGRFSQKSKDAVINMFLALLTQDYDALVVEYLNLAPASQGSRSSANVEAVQRDVADVVAPYHGLPLKDVPAGKILLDATQMAYRHKVSLPTDLVMVFKSIMTLEGIGRSLDPEFDLIGAGSRYARTVLKERYAPQRLLKEAVLMGRDLASLTKTAPRQISELIRQAECGELRLNLKIEGLDAHGQAQARAGSRVAASILASALIIAAVMVSNAGVMPFWAQIALWASAIVGSLVTIYRSLRR